MKTIISGSRTIQDYSVILSAINTAPFRDSITEVFTGMASGPDIFGYRWAMENKKPVRQFYPDWKTHGKPAGIIRNCEMAAYADAAIVIWDGKSHGTAHLLKYMKGLNPPVKVHLVVHRVECDNRTLVDQGRKESA